METVLDQINPGELGREYVQYGDFAFIADTRNLQAVEMCARQYYLTRTELLALTKLENPDDKWNNEQVQKVINQEPTNDPPIINYTASTNKSLFKIQKICFRVKGVVNIAYACPNVADDWLRKPRPLYLGRRSINQKVAKIAALAAPVLARTPAPLMSTAIASIRKLVPSITDDHISQIKAGLPPSDKMFETQYPFFLYPYLISENNTIQNLKGRVFLDQDTQNAVSSLVSSTVTKARRSSGFYFSKDTTDPNDDFLMQKNIAFKVGALINGKIKEFELSAPDPALFTAINLLVTANQNETSQINFAANNRKDSRKTATEIQASTQQASQLSTVQVTLFSIALRGQFTYEVEIIRSRVLAGLIKVNPLVRPLYDRTFAVKPSGDTDVIEKQQLIQSMQNAWPVIKDTPVGPVFFLDMIEKMFPDSAAKYAKAYNDAMAQQKSQQAQQQQQLMQGAMKLGQNVVELSKHPEFFSETGRIHALPVIEQSAQQIQQLQQQMSGGQQNGR
jgi:hypothetical protein